MFFSWEACKHFFLLSRKIITVDGAFLSGHNKGTLLTAVVQDGKEQILLLGYAIVESENLDNWFFLNHLKPHFNLNHSGVIILFDRDRSLISAAESRLPLSIKGHCVRHLKANLQSRSRNKILIDKFWTMAYTYGIADYNRIFNEILSINAEAILSSDLNTREHSKFLIKRFGKNTSNAAESMNSLIKNLLLLILQTSWLVSTISWWIYLVQEDLKLLTFPKNQHAVEQ